jgi:hypothetical protein
MVILTKAFKYGVYNPLNRSHFWGSVIPGMLYENVIFAWSPKVKMVVIFMVDASEDRSMLQVPKSSDPTPNSSI